MMKFFTRKPKSIHVRNIKNGVKIAMDDGTIASVSSVCFMDGNNGNELMMALRGKSAIAMKVSFNDREAIIAHPGDQLHLA